MKQFLFLLLLAALVSPSVAQKARPVPYPVIANPKLEQAVENGTRTTSGQPGSF